MDSSHPTWAKQLITVKEYLPSPGRLIRDEMRYKLRHLHFKSCGYVAVDVEHINSRAVMLSNNHVLNDFSRSNNMPHRVMQRCKDSHFGHIVGYMRPQEEFNLVQGFNMVMGWEHVYDVKVIEDAMVDYVRSPGAGRFSGNLDASLHAIWMGYGSQSSLDDSESD